jgi:TolA-binding protein
MLCSTCVSFSLSLSLFLYIVATSLVTILLTEGYVVTTACLSTMILCPYAAYQKRTLVKLGGLRHQQNQLRSSVNELCHENTILQTSVDKLETAVTELETVQKELDTIAKASQTNVNRLVEICTETATLQTKIKHHLQQQIIQNVIEIVVTMDSNQDWTLGPSEMDMLVMRLKAMPGIEFDEGNYRNAIGKKSTMTVVEIMTILRNLLDDSVAEEDNIFHFTPRALLLQEQ